MNRKKFFSLHLILCLIGCMYAMWKCYEMAFVSDMFERYDGFAQFVWHTLNKASLESKQLALFVWLAILFIIVYVIYFMSGNTWGAVVLSVLLMILSSICHEAFWYIFLIVIFLPEIGIFACIAIGLVILDFLSLNKLESFIETVMQIVLVPMSMVWGASILSFPFQFLESLSAGNLPEENKVAENSKSGEDFERDFLAEAQRDRMEESLRNIERELRDRR